MMKEQASPKWRYRLQLISERKDRQVFSFSMPVWVTALLALLATMLTALLVILVMTRTPLRQYLPGYLDVTKRAEVTEAGMRVDSLSLENDLRSAYMDNMIRVMRGELSGDSLLTYDSAVVQMNDTLIAKSQREADFVQQYEQRERFGIDVLDAKVQPQSMTWIVPFKGEVMISETPLGSEQQNLTCVRLQRECSVLSPLEGTIVYQQYIIGQGWEQMLMAGNDYLVHLSHLTLVLGDPGRQVHAGTAIAHAGAQKEEDDRWVGIRVWHKGKAVDPTSVMNFQQ